MTSKWILPSVIKTVFAFVVFGIVYLFSDFYTAQNVITLIGAIYISLAWIKYLRKDNFLRNLSKRKDEDQDVEPSDWKTSAISDVVPCILIFIIALL